MSKHLDLWPAEKIVYGLPVTSKREMLAALLDVAVKGSRMAGEKRGRLLDALLLREKNGSTAAGGLAIPHAKSDEIKSPLAALGVFPEGIEFTSVDGERVHAVFMILSPLAEAAEHVEILRFVAGVARKPDFMRFLRRTSKPEEARGLLEEMGT